MALYIVIDLYLAGDLEIAFVQVLRAMNREMSAFASYCSYEMR